MIKVRKKINRVHNELKEKSPPELHNLRVNNKAKKEINPEANQGGGVVILVKRGKLVLIALPS